MKNFVYKNRYFLFFLLISLLSYAIPYFINWGNSGRFDFDHFEVFYQILRWWHEIGDYSVTWNPYSCGGATLVGDPQMPLFHPTTFIYLLSDPANALKITVLFWVSCGFFFMYIFSREMGLSQIYSAIAGFFWVLNGYFASHTGVMHLAHFAQFVFPLLLYINIKYAKTTDTRILLLIPPALLLSIVGSPHYIWFCLPIVCFHILFEIIFRKIHKKYLFFYIIAIVIALGLSSFYLLPAYTWHADFEKSVMHEFIRPWYLPISMLYPGKVTFFIRNGRTPHEFIFFVGPVLIYLFFYAFKFRKEFKSFYPLIIIFLIAYVMGWGSFKVLGSPVYSPLDFVKTYIPGFQAAQVPTRFWLGLIPSTIILALFALQLLLNGKWASWSKKKKVALFIFLLAPVWGYNLYSQLRLFGFNEKERSPLVYKDMPYVHTDEFYQVNYTSQMMKLMNPNTGIKNCYQGIIIPTAPALVENHSLLLSAPEGTSFKRPAWDKIEIHLTPQNTQSIIKINQNHHHKWVVMDPSCDAEVISKFREPLTVSARNCKKINLKYFDPSWPLGLKTSLIFALVWIFMACFIHSFTKGDKRKIS